MAAAVSGDLQGPSRSFAASAPRRVGTRRPPPRQRTESVRRAPSTARTDPLPDVADRQDRIASPRKTMPRRYPPQTSRSSDVRIQPPKWIGRNRFGAAWPGSGARRARVETRKALPSVYNRVMAFFRFAGLLAIAFWVGGLATLGVLAAPVLFDVL